MSYTDQMVSFSSKKNKIIMFRVAQDMYNDFVMKHPENAIKSKVLRELLQMYLNDEIKLLKSV